MSSFAPPIFRDGFVYHGQLFVDAGNLNRHPRASEADLTALLRPSKSAKKAPQKDQVGHWYTAQLKHYGLPPTKDKNAAKVRLLDALNAGKLKVPAQVQKLETALKKEYDAANRKVKAELKGKAAASETPAPAKKRKRDEDGSAAAATPATSKKTKAPTKVNTAKTTTARTTTTRTTTTKTTATKTTATKTKTTSTATANTNPTKANPKPTATPTPQRKSNATPKPKETVYASKKGIYLLSVPVVVAEWPTLAAMPKSLKMLLCPDGEKLWGSYNFGPFSGVFLFSEGSQGDIFRFAWRGTDTSDPDRVKFTTGLGDMRFLDEKRIDGSFYNLHGYRCAFEGKLQSGTRQCPRDALSFEHEWEDYGQNNGWFGAPPISVPAGARPPSGSFARSSTLSALKSAEPRYLPNDDPSNMPSKSLKEKTSNVEKHAATKKQPNKQDTKLQSTPVSGSARSTFSIQLEDDFYSNSPSASTPPYDPMDISQITGVYDIECPMIEENFLESQNNLRLLLCRDSRSSRTFGAFAWGPFWGVLQMNPGPVDYSPVSVTLGWRARDAETGDVRFGRGCNGSMEFQEPGVIQGRLFGLYGNILEFWGRRRPGPKNCGHAPGQFEDEWNSFPSGVYGERRGSANAAELYDRYGNLNPRGRYSDLLERSLGD